MHVQKLWDLYYQNVYLFIGSKAIISLSLLICEFNLIFVITLSCIAPSDKGQSINSDSVLLTSFNTSDNLGIFSLSFTLMVVLSFGQYLYINIYHIV